MEVVSPLNIEKVVYGGQGLARHDSKVIFIPFAIKGEKITARITQSKKNYSQGEILRVIDQSPHRIKPKCLHFGSCGGCQFQHMDYKEQLKSKKDILIENISSFIDPSAIHMVGLEDHQWEYREHIKLCFEHGKLGYHGFSNKDVFHVSMCPIFSNNLKDTLDVLESILKKLEILSADIRLLKSENSYIAAIKCEHVSSNHFKELLEHFKGVSIKHDNQRQDLGNCTLTQTYLGKTFQMDAWSFMQAHSKMAEMLYDFVLNQVPHGTNQLLDLYCGSGILSILASFRLKTKIYGIELNPTAIECAKANQKYHGCPNINFIAAPAEHVDEHIKGKSDFIIVNPPREGLSPLMIEEMIKLDSPSICYISCNPTTLARDLKKFSQNGYKVTKAQGFDLFPQTTHLETVCVLNKYN